MSHGAYQPDEAMDASPVAKLPHPAVKHKSAAQIVEDVSSAIGQEFFESLATHLGQSIGADCLYLGEFAGGKAERAKTLAGYVSGAQTPAARQTPPAARPVKCKSDYVLAGTVAALVATGESWSCTRGALKRFPNDELLLEIGAQACVAVPLLDDQNRSLGVIMAAFRRPLENTRQPKSMLERFAPRAAGELRHKQAEEALRESQQRYQAFITLNAEAMWRIEFELPIPTSLSEEEQLERIYRFGYLAECNDAMARLLGYKNASQVVGAGFEDLARHADPRLRDELRRAIRSGYRFDTVETAPTDKTGCTRHLVRSQWGIVENGALQRIWGTTRDVTELKRAEEALQASEKRIAELIESTRMLTVMLDLDGSVTFCNDYLLRLTGWRAGDVAGKNWFDLMVPPEEREKAKAEFAAAAHSPSPRHFESTLLGTEGRRWRIAWENTIWRDSEGRIAGVAGVGRDVTVLKALETQTRQAQKLDAIKRSVARMVHDFSSLLTVIGGYSQILLQSKTQEDKEYAPLKEIKNAARAATALTGQLLAFTSQQTLHPKLLDLNAVIKAVGKKLASLLPENIVLQLELDPALSKIRADSSQLVGVLLSLANNAIEAMPDGGRLTIQSENVDIDEAAATQLPGVPAGRYVLLAVSDTGVGMSEEVQAHLFEPFFSTKTNARGLGLPAIYGIVQQSGGQILVESKPGDGATFRIYLPQAIDS